MKEEFPKLKVDEVALLRADVITGHVLDEQLKLAVKDNQVIYSVIRNLDEALDIARRIITEGKNIECVIYGKDKKVLFYLNSKNFNF